VGTAGVTMHGLALHRLAVRDRLRAASRRHPHVG
jgi:hypothetical protein